MIYIDPPYNTGKDFIYPDNYSENLDTYLEYTGQIDGEGRKFNSNVDTDGRFHSKWMNMMYPRLFLAKNLLREDGVIFISIDDNEVKNLRSLCDEIFGEESFIGNAIWRSKDNSNNDSKKFSCDHNHTLVYGKRNDWQPAKLSDDSKRSHFKNPDNDPKGAYFDGNPLNSPSYRENLIYDLYSPQNYKISPPKNGWRWSKDIMEEKIKTGEIRFTEDGQSIRRRTYLCEMEGLPPSSLWIDLDKTGHNRQAKYELLNLIPEDVFQTPKPIKLLKYIAQLSDTQDEDIILDFFAGSATTAHAVMDLNKEDGIKRRFICVQLPELTDEKSEAYKVGYKTIAEISKERIRRAAAKIKEEIEQSIATEKRKLISYQSELQKFSDDLLYTLDRKQEHQDAEDKVHAQVKLIEEKQLLLEKIDLGFRVFKLQKSNFKVWDANTEKDADAIQQALELHIDHIDPQAEQEAILFELLLKSGFELTTPIENLTLAGKTVFSIAEGALLICLDKTLTSEVIKAMAELNPSRVICLDEGFQDNDQLKTNAVLIMKSKGVNDFRTV